MCIVCGRTFETESIYNIFCAQHDTTSLAYSSTIHAGTTTYNPTTAGPDNNQQQYFTYHGTFGGPTIAIDTGQLIAPNTEHDVRTENLINLHKNGLKIVNGKLVKII